MTPVSSPVNTLVVGPGNYRFIDFLRIGAPFTAVTPARLWFRSCCVLTTMVIHSTPKHRPPPPQMGKQFWVGAARRLNGRQSKFLRARCCVNSGLPSALHD
jgi:hypothetical protein